MVLDPSENYERGRVWLDGIPLELVSQVQGPSKVTPFADKITTGDTSRSSDPVLSTWILEDFTGGLGVLNMDPQRQIDRYRFGTLWAINPKSLRLGAGPVSYTRGIPADTSPRGLISYGSTDYCVFDRKVRFLAMKAPGGPLWTTPVEAGYVDLQSSGTSIATLRLVGRDFLFIADGDGLLRFDGATWVYQPGNLGPGPDTCPFAQYLSEWDDELYALDVNGMLWHTADAVTWTQEAQVPVLAGTCRGLDVFFDQDNNPALHTPSRSGLWAYVAQDRKWYRTRLRWARHPRGGDGHTTWQDEYYESAGLDMFHYTGQQVNPLSLNRDDGLPIEYAGSISALCGLLNWLVVAVDGAASATHVPLYRTATARFSSPRLPVIAGRSALYLWTGSAFQPLWIGAQNANPVTWLTQSSASGVATLWWADGRVPMALSIGNGLINPREVPHWAYQPSGWLESSRFDANWIEQPKLAIRTLIRVEELPLPGGSIAISYRRDREAPWTQFPLITAPGLYTFAHEQTDGAADGLPWYEWEYRIGMVASDDGRSPVLVFVKLEYVRLPVSRWGYRFQARVCEDQGGLTPEQQMAQLLAAVSGTRLVPFVYRPADRSPVTRRCLITSFAATGLPGMETQQLVNLALEEA